MTMLSRLTQRAVIPRRLRTQVMSCTAQSSRAYWALTYDTPGEPLDVLKHTEHHVNDPQRGQVEVQWLQAPINPSDINTVQGKYPILPKLPGGVPGHEGVGVITRIGPEVHGLLEGDHVVALEAGQGTWRERGIHDAHNLHRVPREMPLEAAATLCINPPSALAMLENFEELKPGDVVVQNGATSAVGQAVIMIAKARGLKTINIIRDRPDWDATVAWLKGMGADLVTTEERLKEDMKASNLGLGSSAPRLGLNCVGGSAALCAAKVMADSGTLVTYGGMSLKPVSIPTSLLIFKDLRFRGFWLSGKFAKEQGVEGRKAMLDRLVAMVMDGSLQAPRTKVFPLEQFREAFTEYDKAHRGCKIILRPSSAPTNHKL